MILSVQAAECCFYKTTPQIHTHIITRTYTCQVLSYTHTYREDGDQKFHQIAIGQPSDKLTNHLLKTTCSQLYNVWQIVQPSHCNLNVYILMMMLTDWKLAGPTKTVTMKTFHIQEAKTKRWSSTALTTQLSHGQTHTLGAYIRKLHAFYNVV